MENKGVTSANDDSCRREQLPDRRSRHLKAVLMAPFIHRRAGPRRDHERAQPHYVDIHEPWVMMAVLLTVVMCVADVFFTLTIIDLGGEEVNPFMRYLMERDITTFFVVKFIVTSFGLVFTIVHKNFKIFSTISGYHIIIGAFTMYAVLIAYEIMLLI